MSKLIISRVPFRISLGGGSTDLPSYYEKHGGFIFSAAINLYMDVFVKEPRSDDLIHVHYRSFEAVPTIEEVEHDLAKEALRQHGINKKIAISFKADTPAGTGLGSSGACAVAIHKALAAFTGKELSNLEAAEHSFQLTRNLGLPDGVQDPYACAIGGFVVLNIGKDGRVVVEKPDISPATVKKFMDNTLFYYTGVSRESKHILSEQDKEKSLELKHRTKQIGLNILNSFKEGNLDDFGSLLDEHWHIKKQMSPKMTSDVFDEIYEAAKSAGASGGKIMGAGGGGYFMFYCPSQKVKKNVEKALEPYGLRKMDFQIDEKGARTSELEL